MSWKNPSQQHMQKYGLVPLPDSFDPTEEEKLLLEMYGTLQQLEKQAARLKEEAARAKLAEKDAAFKQKMAPKRKTHRHKKKEKASGQEIESEEESVEASSEEEEPEEDPQTIQERREAKLAALRAEIENAEIARVNKEDVMRTELLQTQAEDEGLQLKRKKLKTEEMEPVSLIANLTAGGTPPHDFSKSLGLTVTRGKVLFPTSTAETMWVPPPGVFSPNDGAFVAQLQDFDVNRAQNGQGNNTLAVKFHAPSDSKRFSINIATEGTTDFTSVLFHFNPRQFEKGGQLVLNDKQDGIWGQSIAVPLSQVPLIFGQTASTLIVQITGDGFDIFIDQKHCARLEHRTELPSTNTTLTLQFPSTDDYGSPESWVVYKVWWGNSPIMAKGDVSGVAGVNTYNALHPRKLFVSGLSKIFTEGEVDVRRAELERAFRKYGGDRGVVVIVPTNATYAFVETQSERQADLALSEMVSQYRLNRARRSRHEALQEERAAKEAAKLDAASGVIGKKEGTTWD